MPMTVSQIFNVKSFQEKPQKAHIREAGNCEHLVDFFCVPNLFSS